MEKAVITGTGIVSPIGNGTENFFSNLLAGKSGIRKISKDSFSQFPGGESETGPDDWKTVLKVPENSTFPETTTFALAALAEALQKAGLSADDLKKKRAAVILGGSSSFSEVSELYKTEYDSLYNDPADPVSYDRFCCYQNGYNTAAAIAAILQIRGAVETISNACASGSAAIGKAADLIRKNKYDIVITGGADSGIDVNTLSLFSVLNVMSKDNDIPRSCRPFSRNRKGCVIGEGAGILIAESAASAAERNAKPYAEIIGCASVSDPSHITSPDMTGKAYEESMSKALENSIYPDINVDYINAHGTGTYYNDMLETLAIKTLFGKNAYNIPVSSVKAQTGHLLSASGAVECIAVIEAFQKGILPPTMNLDEKDEQCDLDYIPGKPRKAAVRTALSNSFGFGGQNTSLLLMKG